MSHQDTQFGTLTGPDNSSPVEEYIPPNILGNRRMWLYAIAVWIAIGAISWVAFH